MLLAQALCRRAGITAMAGVASQLAADGAGAAALKAGYGPDAPACVTEAGYSAPPSASARKVFRNALPFSVIRYSGCT